MAAARLGPPSSITCSVHYSMKTVRQFKLILIAFDLSAAEIVLCVSPLIEWNKEIGIGTDLPGRHSKTIWGTGLFAK